MRSRYGSYSLIMLVIVAAGEVVQLVLGRFMQWKIAMFM